MSIDLYRDVMDRIRARNRGLIINLTTGPGGRFVPSEADPRVAGPGTTLIAPEKRVEHVELLRPDICTLDLNTMNSGGQDLIIQAVISFGVGGYIAGRTRTASAASHVSEIEHRDGLHGLAAWALAVVLGALLAALIGSAALTRSNSTLPAARTSAAEPLLSYELDRLFRPSRRAANVDLASERAEAGRILLTTSSHTGIAAEDRGYLVQMVAATTGLAGADAEKRADTAIANAKTAIDRSRRSTVILAFSVAAALLLGAVIAGAAAAAGGRHRDGAPYACIGWAEEYRELTKGFKTMTREYDGRAASY